MWWTTLPVPLPPSPKDHLYDVIRAGPVDDEASKRAALVAAGERGLMVNAAFGAAGGFATGPGGPSDTVTVRLVELWLPPSSVTVSRTVWVPGRVYPYDGRGPDARDPSPKSHS